MQIECSFLTKEMERSEAWRCEFTWCIQKMELDTQLEIIIANIDLYIPDMLVSTLYMLIHLKWHVPYVLYITIVIFTEEETEDWLTCESVGLIRKMPPSNFNFRGKTP